MNHPLMERKQQVPAITQKTIEDYLFSSNTRLTDQQKKLFIQIALANNLNPFNREIYAVAYGQNFSIITGYQVYVKRAEASGKLNGWNVLSDGEKATITIWRKDFEQPIIWTVKKTDFDKQTGSWKTMPDFMLKKIAICQGFRMAFPNELASMPYGREEVDEQTGELKITTRTRAPRGSKNNPLVQTTAATEKKPPASADENTLRQIYKQVMDETGNDLDLVRDLINELGKETFSQLTLKEAFDILSQVKRPKKQEAHV